MSFGASRLLTPAAERQLVDVRQHLGQLRDLLVALPATAADLAALVASIRQLDELFLLVVVGEFNAGKSAFVNALLGERVFEEGVTPTTAQHPADSLRRRPSGARRARRARPSTAPVELLRDLHIVDTPGTNAIIASTSG